MVYKGHARVRPEPWIRPCAPDPRLGVDSLRLPRSSATHQAFVLRTVFHSEPQKLSFRNEKLIAKSVPLLDTQRIDEKKIYLPSLRVLRSTSSCSKSGTKLLAESSSPCTIQSYAYPKGTLTPRSHFSCAGSDSRAILHP